MDFVASSHSHGDLGVMHHRSSLGLAGTLAYRVDDHVLRLAEDGLELDLTGQLALYHGPPAHAVAFTGPGMSGTALRVEYTE